MTLQLPEGITAQPATDAEARAAYHRGRKAGADFVILVRETEEDGTVDEQTLMVFAPPGNKQRPMFLQMAQQGVAIYCGEDHQQ